MSDIVFDANKDKLQALGRNGYINCCGVEIYKIESANRVRITPLTCKGLNVGRCFIELPINQLGEIIDLLKQVQSQKGGL